VVIGIPICLLLIGLIKGLDFGIGT
jgi:hypothetical protein